MLTSRVATVASPGDTGSGGAKLLADDDAAMLLLGDFQEPAGDVHGVARRGDVLMVCRAEPRTTAGSKCPPMSRKITIE
jgi:hypothetical protein